MRYRVILFSIYFFSFLAVSAQEKMTAHFIDVGQADATLLEFPCGAVLIDAGAQSVDHEKKLIRYLKGFFERRSDLNSTLDLVIITHAHIDHNLSLDDIVDNFTVKRYIDNGLNVGSGRRNQNWLRNNADDLGITYATYTYEDITANGNRKGIADNIIDPIDCGDTDPEIMLLSGRFKRKPAGWPETEYSKNGNNHSIVVKISFGESSFLFTGDLEIHGIEKLLETYDPAILDVDILRVGHHGAHNGTTPEYLNAVTPTHAIISCGKWYYGRPNVRFTTHTYGHPRIVVLDQLSEVIEGERSEAITIKAAFKATNFKNYTITKRIYATPWDKTIQIDAQLDGTYRVTRNN